VLFRSIKTPDSYKNPASSPYSHHEFWQEVFSPVYGPAPELPYSAIRVSLDVKNKTQQKEWLDKIADEGIRTRFINWMRSKNKEMVPTLLLPRAMVENIGMPKEVVCAMNIRKLIYSTVRPFYLVLESLGIYMVNENQTRLVSDVVYGHDALVY